MHSSDPAAELSWIRLHAYLGPLMAILSTTICYPNPAAPALGLFVQKRLAEIHKRIPVRVVAPIPICPPVRHRPAIPYNDASIAPPVAWPSMFYVPGILKTLDAHFYARALDAAIDSNPSLNDFKLIDAHFVWPDGVGAWRVARKHKLPFVCTIRGKLVSQAKFPARRKMIAEMLRDADRRIAVSQSLADLACKVAGRSLDITVIPNGIDTNIFFPQTSDRHTESVGPANSRSSHRPLADDKKAEPLDVERENVAPESGVPESEVVESEVLESGVLEGVGPANSRSSHRPPAGDKIAGPLVISVGHLQRLKGFHRLIDAWPDVMRQHKKARLILVGGPAGEPAYEREIQNLATRLNDSSPQDTAPPITFAGRKSPTEIAALLNAADCFALASDSEGWCNAIAEALACGCPVVATDVGGNREQLGSDESFGRLVPLDDPNALASAIVGTIENPSDRAAISRHGSRRSWQQVAAECVDVYASLLS